MVKSKPKTRHWAPYWRFKSLYRGKEAGKLLFQHDKVWKGSLVDELPAIVNWALSVYFSKAK